MNYNKTFKESILIMSHTLISCWEKSLLRLKEGNKKYLNSEKSEGNISIDTRQSTCLNGQKPYATVISCSDSRVIPECIFSAGIGELFVIRTAGNVMDDVVVGSVEYAVSSLATPLVVVMGHTYCGAIRATIQGGAKGYIKAIAQKINLAINDEKDECAACRLNLNASANELRRLLAKEEYDVKVIGALYHTDTGQVEFFDADV